MTATPRLWQLGDADEAGAPGELVASMDDDPGGPFGSRCFTLTLSEAVDRGICAPYQVVCVDVTDTQLQAAQLLGAEGRSEQVRGARLAALQTALMKASSEEDFRRTLAFHHLVAEAEAFAAGLPDIAAQLHAAEPELYPRTIWADWLCGEHKPLHRRRVLDEFAAGITADGTIVEKGYLSSVRVLGEGVDTKNCDSVYFADVRGSMPDLVQAVGRALRMQPGEGKTASLVVPVLLGARRNSRQHAHLPRIRRPRQTAGGAAGARHQGCRTARRTASSKRRQGRTKPQRGAGRRESLEWPAVGAGPGTAEVQHPTRPRPPWPRSSTCASSTPNTNTGGAESKPPSSTNSSTATYASRSPTASQKQHRRLQQPHGRLRRPWAGKPSSGRPSLAGFPLGQWTADARRFYARGTMDADRVEQLEKLGMIWSHFDVAWEEGLAAARAWATEHGHLLAPLDATHQGAKVGIFLKNARAAARKAAEIEQRRAEGLPVESSAGALSDERREQLEEIDASWRPSWPVTWQRCFHLVRMHLDAGEALPTKTRQVLRQGEDLGRWVQAQQLGWDKLTSVQQWMCEHVLGIQPARDEDKPKPRTSQAEKWAMHYTAAKQYYEREGHLQVPRKHIETITRHRGQRPRRRRATTARSRDSGSCSSS
ncbi:hypothetical protein QFZ58_006848 [Streptomyces sp. B1I3]|nr:hypothetical protein [Streptomyces sp. B1I3]